MTPSEIMRRLGALAADRELVRAIEDLVAVCEHVRARAEKHRIRMKKQRARASTRARTSETQTPKRKTLDLRFSEESLKESPTVGGTKSRGDRGCRLPKGWRPSSADIEFARGLIGQAWHLEAEKFNDYWNGKPGAAGRKTDWPGTWRNWIRKATENRKGGGNGFHRKTLREVGDELIDELRARENAANGSGPTCDQDAFGLSGNGRDLFEGISGDASANVVPIPARGCNGRG